MSVSSTILRFRSYAAEEQCDPDGVRRDFEAEHERTYGHASPSENCEVRSARLILRYAGVALRPNDLAGNTPQGALREGDMREIYFGPQLGMQMARLRSRKDLPDQPIQGPVVIPEYDTTIIVPPDFTVRRETSNALILERVAAGD